MKKIISVVLSAAMALGLAACGSQAGAVSSQPSSSAAPQPSAQAVSTVQLAGLKGPTTMGMVNLNTLMENGTAAQQYDVSMLGTADEIVPQLVKGEVDIAAIPANLAAALYQKTEGGIQALAVNTLGVLYVVEQGDTVHSVQDLKGKTLLSTGKGTTPEYVMNYLLDAAGIADSVTLEFKSEATEVVSVLASDPTAVGVLPQPFATAALVKNQALAAPIDLTEAWDEVSEQTGDDSQLVTGVTVVRNEFLDEHPEAIEEFLKGQSASVEYVNEHPDKAAKLVVEHGILESEAVAQKAIPACHLVCLTGKELKQALAGYLEVLHQADASSVGGSLPADDFYYQA